MELEYDGLLQSSMGWFSRNTLRRTAENQSCPAPAVATDSYNPIEKSDSECEGDPASLFVVWAAATIFETQPAVVEDRR